MSRPRSGPTGRWVDRPMGGAKLEDRIAALLRKMPPAEPLAANRIAAVGARIVAQGPAAHARLWRWAPVVAAVVLGNAGVVFGTRALTSWVRPPRSDKPAPAAATTQRQQRPKAPKTTPTIPKPTSQAAAPSEPTPASAAAAPTRDPRPRAAPVARAYQAAMPPPELAVPPVGPVAVTAGPPAPAPATDPGSLPSLPPAPNPSPSTLAAETELLGQALRALRQGGQPAAAIAVLDQYQVLFPAGSLAREAAVARVDALLAQGSRREALDLLSALSVERMGRRHELLVIRGELRSASGGCAAAAEDFTLVLAEPAAPAFHERALHGRAACLLRQGETARAENDLREYLRRFPEGRFAAEVRQDLERR